jgi:hypothetical protein
MPAAIARLTIDNGIRSFFCPACGFALLKEEVGLEDSVCDHVIGVIDWLGEYQASPRFDNFASQITALVEAHGDAETDALADIADVLSDSALVVEFCEPGRGGGHEGSVLTFILNFPPG